MNDKAKAKELSKILKKLYGKEIPMYLKYHKNRPYEFLFSVMMSARCKDESVNKVTEKLYKKYDSLAKISKIKQETLEKMIYSLGFYKDKAKNVLACAKTLINQYKGKIPKEVEELIKLPGVGRKTANVVVSTLYNKPAMAVDTHVARLTKKIFGRNFKDVKEIEGFLCGVVDKKDWRLYNTHLIAHGRKICKGEKPICRDCGINKICSFYKKISKNEKNN